MCVCTCQIGLKIAAPTYLLSVPQIWHCLGPSYRALSAISTIMHVLRMPCVAFHFGADLPFCLSFLGLFPLLQIFPFSGLCAGTCPLLPPGTCRVAAGTWVSIDVLHVKDEDVTRASPGKSSWVSSKWHGTSLARGKPCLIWAGSQAGHRVQVATSVSGSTCGTNMGL